MRQTRVRLKQNFESGGVMGISDKMGNLVNDVEDGIKTTSFNLLQQSVRIVSSIVISSTLALIFQELINYGTFSLVFFTLTISGAFYKIFSSWTLTKILVFDLIFILVAQLLKMYILLAP